MNAETEIRHRSLQAFGAFLSERQDETLELLRGCVGKPIPADLQLRMGIDSHLSQMLQAEGTKILLMEED